MHPRHIFPISFAAIILLFFLTCFSGCLYNSAGLDNNANQSEKAGINNSTSADKLIGQVTQVVDGDTIWVDLNNNSSEKVRLIGVDTPETVHPTIGEEPYGREASNYTKSRLTDQQIELELDVQDRDQYGRLLAYVWIGSELFNETLVRQGYAQLSTYPPNVKYVDRFTAAQTVARNASLGLWGIEQTASGSDSSNNRLDNKNNPPAGSYKYIGSSRSDKYHYLTCKYAETISPQNQVFFSSRADAESAGYRPCANCNP
ncbi:nuclease(snase)domain [hydrocarbon metagenome]|uniref:Nuclease(Snase)domain n=1 Tax=hydrocarbon metagenome TaxID=938273 RepID=A0A0W8E3U0_9ZZZZ